MRVLHVSAGNLYGGVESLILTLATHRMEHLDHEMQVALCFDGRLGRELDGVGAPWHRLPSPRASRPASVLRARRALKTLLGAQPFDRVICHSQWSLAMFGSTVRRAGVPLVLWVHGSLVGRHWSEKWAARTRPDLAICTSRFTALTVPNLYRDTPAVVVHPPVDGAAAPLSQAERASVRRELSTDEASIVIVQASRVEAWKGHTVLLDALGRLRDEPGWVWWQVGGAQRAFEQQYLASLVDRATRLGIADRVRFAGERSDVRRVLGAADILCQANVEPEPFGIALVEALAAGLPVVTAALGGALEIVDSTCGVLVAPSDSEALAEALGTLLRDRALRARLAAEAPRRARRISDPARQMHLLNEALQSVGAVAVS